MEQNQVKLLDFEQNPCEVMTLQDLEKTHRENYPDGSPVGDIYHFQLMQTILEAADSEGLHPELKEVFAVNNRHKRSPGVTILPELADKNGKGSLESHILRRVFANITLHGDFSNDERTYNIAVSYTQQGILVGFGPFVYACHNQTICRSECLISNYSVRGFGRLESTQRDIKVLINNLRERIHITKEEAFKEVEEVETLKQKQLMGIEIDEFVGLLVRERVAAESEEEKIHMAGYAPLSSAHINSFVENLLVRGMYAGASAYDILQGGTSYMKPGNIPFENICPQSLALYTALKQFV